MTVTREQRTAALLEKRCMAEWPAAVSNALMLRAIECLQTEKGYSMVSAPSGARKTWQARTSGKPCGQRDLGAKFTSAEAAAEQVVLWIVGIVPTPPTPPKERMARNTGKAKVDRCNHGKGALPFFPPTLLLTRIPMLLFTGGPDLRTSDYRSKKSKPVQLPSPPAREDVPTPTWASQLEFEITMNYTFEQLAGGAADGTAATMRAQ